MNHPIPKLLLIILCLLMISPSMAADSWESVSITDDYGFTSLIENEPLTIVSLSPTTTEILFALGLGERVIGVTEYCNYPEDAKTKTIIGGYSSINIEKIIALNPDIIFGNIGNGLANIEHLRKLNETVICIDPDSVEGSFHAIQLIGKATGKETEAETLVSSMKERVNSVQEALKNSDEHTPTITHVMSSDPIWVSGSSTFQNELIELSGGTNAFPEVDGWGIISLERLLTKDPDIILVDSGAGMGDKGENILKQTFMTEPRLQSLSAVKNGRVYVMDSDTFDRGGPRIVDALDDLAKITHPEVFGEHAKPTATTEASGFGIVTLLSLAGVLLAIRK